jgi:YVTN family beta-propeller protein
VVTDILSDSVSVINTATDTVLASISVGGHPTGLSFNPDGTRVYVTSNAAIGKVNVISTGTNTIIDSIKVGSYPIAFGDFISTYLQTSGITSLNLESENISVYPNPSSRQFTISLPTADAEIMVTNLLGQQIIKTKTVQKTTNLQLDNNGVYLVYVITKQGTETRKLIINR